MIFRSGHGIGCWSQLRLAWLVRHSHKLAPANLERVAGSIGIGLARLKVGNEWTGTIVTPQCRRTYARTAVSRPKAHTGRTTTAPRKEAATQTRTKSAAQPKRKQAPRAKGRSGAAAKSRRTAGRPRKTTRPRAKAPRKARKPLSDRTKQTLAAKKNRADVKKLKQRALSPPTTGNHASVFFAFLAEQRSVLRQNGGNLTGRGATTKFHKEMGLKFRALSPAQLEHYNHLYNQQRHKEQVEYHKWLKSHTPTQIKDANLARRALGRRGLKPSGQIKDERKVTNVRNAYLWYMLERHASGDYRGMTPTQTVKLIASEWKASTPGEKKKFQDLQVQDQDRYHQEYKTVYGVDPPSVTRPRRSPQRRRSTTNAPAATSPTLSSSSSRASSVTVQ